MKIAMLDYFSTINHYESNLAERRKSIPMMFKVLLSIKGLGIKIA